MKKETIVGGIRASGNLHIGNYLGALKPFVELSTDQTKENFFFIADLHALTTPFKPESLKSNTLEVAAEYIAVGLNINNCAFFLQNHIHEHSELAWIFNCILPIAELERMTQYKDKSQEHRQNINAGLLTYPALMAADILVYKAQGVAVGYDQAQHVELARVVAKKFNNQFTKIFPEPKTYTSKPLRIMSLKNPDKKMSKTTDEPLYLDDEPEVIYKKIKKAVTEGGGGGKSGGAENLLFLISQFGSEENKNYFTNQQKHGALKYSELKEMLANDVSNYFAEFREKKKGLLSRPEKLAQILGDGARKARQVANETLKEVKEKIGLL